ncbi:hypothetical protein [Streptomyces sp. NPDC050422]|uniref:hypothetical protein n=1 Tax=Streptomyces sp. NPDC050422 TaxID=3365614 RepID=UPI00379134CD
MNQRRCALASCGRALPKNADHRKRYCGDACRKSANRAKHARERIETVTHLKPPSAPVGDSERVDDLRAVWRLLVDSVAAHGVVVPGSAGAPVSHPALRFLAGIDAALLAHEKVTPDVSTADPLEAARAAALRAVAAYDEREGVA